MIIAALGGSKEATVILSLTSVYNNSLELWYAHVYGLQMRKRTSQLLLNGSLIAEEEEEEEEEEEHALSFSSQQGFCSYRRILLRPADGIKGGRMRCGVS
jgi:hypothetical protein